MPTIYLRMRRTLHKRIPSILQILPRGSIELISLGRVHRVILQIYRLECKRPLLVRYYMAKGCCDAFDQIHLSLRKPLSPKLYFYHEGLGNLWVSTTQRHMPLVQQRWIEGIRCEEIWCGPLDAANAELRSWVDENELLQGNYPRHPLAQRTGHCICEIRARF